MANKGLRKKLTTRKMLGATAIYAVLGIWSVGAFAMEITTKVSMVDVSGRLQLERPEGATPAVGDIVHVKADIDGQAPIELMSQWTVKAVLKDTIIAHPTGTLTATPLVGYTAIIEPAPMQAEAPVEQDTVAEKAETEGMVVAEETAPAPEIKPSSDVEQISKTPGAQTGQPDDAEEPKAEVIAKEVKSEEASDPAKPEMSAGPAPLMDCDRFAAHPFDPDAVAKGVDYPKLSAEKVIEACNEAIKSYPNEARFYTQLTRGLHKAGKFDEALVATQKGAELGSAHSMAFLGVMYAQGSSVPKDLKLSLEWLEKAAANGNPGGMVFAAAMYRDGTGTTRNYKRAAELYQMATDMKVAEAMTSLGVFYDRGQGVEKSPEKAATLLLDAIKGEDKEAQKLMFEAPGAISKEARELIQTQLKQKGFYRGAIDGDFGTGTKNALIRFRRAK